MYTYICIYIYIYTQDSNDDGQVSEEEFVQQQSIRGAGIKEAYSCLDTDHNGQITRTEMWDLKNQFWRSKLSKLSQRELVNWMSNPNCVDTDISEYLPAIQKKQVCVSMQFVDNACSSCFARKAIHKRALFFCKRSL